MITFGLVDKVIKNMSVLQGDRADQLRRIIDEFTAEQSNLFEILAQAKQELSMLLRRRNYSHAPWSAATKRLMSKIASDRMNQHEADGLPGSLERATQTEHLWTMNYPDLHIRIPHEQKDDWLDRANNVDEGTSYFASSIASGTKALPHLPLVRRSFPEVVKPTIEHDREATAAWAAQMKEARKGCRAYDSEVQAARMLGRLKRPAQSDLEDWQVQVGSSGIVQLDWSDDTVEPPVTTIIKVSLPKWMIRFEISFKFVDQGIQLMRMLEDGSMTLIETWTVDKLKARQNPNLLRCWQRQRQTRESESTSTSAILTNTTEAPSTRP